MEWTRKFGRTMIRKRSLSLDTGRGQYTARKKPVATVAVSLRYF